MRIVKRILVGACMAFTIASIIVIPLYLKMRIDWHIYLTIHPDGTMWRFLLTPWRWGML